MSHAELLLQHQLHPDDSVDVIAHRLALAHGWTAEEQRQIRERLYDIRKTATALLMQETMNFPLFRTLARVEEYFAEYDRRLTVARRQAEDMDEH